MRVYSVSEAQRSLSVVVRTAKREGAVGIRVGNGETFVLRPEPLATERSPLDVPGVDFGLRRGELVRTIRQMRRRTTLRRRG